MHDTAVWVEYESTGCCDPGNYCIDYYETIWLMQGDTFVNNLTYKKLFFEVIGYWSNLPQSGCITCGFWSDGVFWQPYLFGLIREDSTKKVFIIANPNVTPPVVCSVTDFSTEKILYDFNLQLGDTVAWKPFDNVVIGIDSVQAPNGEYLRRIKFDDYLDQWIEGLGSRIALFGSYMWPPFECGCVLDCAEATDLVPPGLLLCDFPVEVHNVQSNDKLQIAPNPFSDLISVTSPFQSTSVLLLINSQGQIMLQKRLHPFEKISFSQHEFRKEEIIFLKLISDNGESESGIAIHVH